MPCCHWIMPWGQEGSVAGLGESGQYGMVEGELGGESVEMAEGR